MTDTHRDSWSTRLFDQLVEAGVTLFVYVPDAGNKRLIELADAELRTRAVLLTSEEEGVAICAGADLVGRRAVLCMQSAGVGNCGNFLSLVKGGGFPILMIVSMRGDYGEENPWQFPWVRRSSPCWRPWGCWCSESMRQTISGPPRPRRWQPATRRGRGRRSCSRRSSSAPRHFKKQD